MIENMICVAFVCTILFIPVMVMYYQGAAYDQDAGFLNRIVIGNLGHSESTCNHDYLKLNVNTKISCTKGKISQLKAFGLMPDADSDQSKAFGPDFCGKSTKYTVIDDCT